FFHVFVDLTAPTATLAAVTPDPRATPVSSVDVIFSEPINETTFDRGDFSLTRDNGANLINAGVSLLYVSGTTYRLGGLAGLTDASGAYQLTLNVAGVQATAAKAGIGSLTESWRVGSNTPPVTGRVV